MPKVKIRVPKNSGSSSTGNGSRRYKFEPEKRFPHLPPVDPSSFVTDDAGGVTHIYDRKGNKAGMLRPDILGMTPEEAAIRLTYIHQKIRHKDVTEHRQKWAPSEHDKTNQQITKDNADRANAEQGLQRCSHKNIEILAAHAEQALGSPEYIQKRQLLRDAKKSRKEDKKTLAEIPPYREPIMVDDRGAALTRIDPNTGKKLRNVSREVYKPRHSEGSSQQYGSSSKAGS